MRLAARCSQKLLVSISYVPFRAADYAKSGNPSPPGCLSLALFGSAACSGQLPLGAKADPVNSVIGANACYAPFA